MLPLPKETLKVWLCTSGEVKVAPSNIGLLPQPEAWLGCEPVEEPLTEDEAEKVLLIIADRCVCEKCKKSGRSNDWVLLTDASLMLFSSWSAFTANPDAFKGTPEAVRGKLLLLEFSIRVSMALKKIRNTENITVKTVKGVAQFPEVRQCERCGWESECVKGALCPGCEKAA